MAKPLGRKLNEFLETYSIRCIELAVMGALIVLCAPTLRTQSRELPPVFLAPLLATSPSSLVRRNAFSTSPPVKSPKGKRRDGNPHRGESALRRTGPRMFLAMFKMPLPQPVLDPKRRSKIQTDPDHGLWGFFSSEKQALTKPEDDHAHGAPMFCYHH